MPKSLQIKILISKSQILTKLILYDPNSNLISFFLLHHQSPPPPQAAAPSSLQQHKAEQTPYTSRWPLPPWPLPPWQRTHPLGRATSVHTKPPPVAPDSSTDTPTYPPPPPSHFTQTPPRPPPNNTCLKQPPTPSLGLWKHPSHTSTQPLGLHLPKQPRTPIQALLSSNITHGNP